MKVDFISSASQQISKVLLMLIYLPTVRRMQHIEQG
jgi:hypothetical protein